MFIIPDWLMERDRCHAAGIVDSSPPTIRDLLCGGLWHSLKEDATADSCVRMSL
jgi:hypothetical protein